MRTFAEIGNQKILVDALQGTSEEKWLYKTMEELSVIKEQYDKRAAEYFDEAMSATRYPFEQVYPDPSAVYDVSLRCSVDIAAIIIYKNINCRRYYFECGVTSRKLEKQEKEQLILNMIRNDDRIAYFEIINAIPPEEKLEETLEGLIDRRKLSWEPKSGRYHDNYNGWRINNLEN